MSKIRIMDQTLANMIAAGEVVERPASVVKELVENSIDAQSTKIEVFINKAGRESIIVQDDGVGMDKEDAILAFKRHATSKIFDQHSLFYIESLGFRGEALPSISSVSKLTLETSTGDVGTKVVSHPNEELEVSYTSARKGTIIKVEDLFYNTPARLKHLKSDYTEVANIQDVITKLALAHPNIAFSLTIDGRTTFQTSGNNKLIDIIASIYGLESAKQMTSIELENDDFTINGYISKIGLTKANRYYMTILLNGRPIRMNSAINAIIDAYKTFIPVDRYPICVLKIDTDPTLIDVNVHPAKHEVRLSKEESLISLIKEGVKEKLSSLVMNVKSVTKQVNVKIVQPKLNLEVKEPITSSYKEDIPLVKKEWTLEDKDEVNIDEVVSNELSDIKNEEVNNAVLQEKIEQVIKEVKEPSYNEIIIENEEENVESFLNKLTVIGQMHGSYIIASSDDGFYLIDQHAAMERINYEYYSKVISDNRYITPLLIPLIIELSISDINLLKERLNLLESIGIKAELFGNNAIRISEVPSWMGNIDVKTYCEDMIDYVLKKNPKSVLLIEEAVMTLACKASLKANKSLTMEEMQTLLIRLGKCKNPNSCPHGRPTMIFYSKYSIEKTFRRVG